MKNQYTQREVSSRPNLQTLARPSDSVTGRVSSTEPSIQNLPIKSLEARKVILAFRDRQIVESDL